MPEIPQQVPLHEQLIEKVHQNGRFQTALTPGELRALFARQAEADESGDLPVLLPGFRAVIRQGQFHLHAPYTIDEDRKSLAFDGTGENNEEGVLAETTPLSVSPPSLRDRVVEAFGGTLNLPHFAKLIIEDALRGEVTVEKLFIDGENLGMVLEKSIKED